MKVKTRHVVDIIVAIIGFVGIVLGGTTVSTNIKVHNAAKNYNNVEVSVGDSAGEIAIKLLDKNEELLTKNEKLRNEIKTLNQQVEQLRNQNDVLSANSASSAELESITEERDSLVKERDELKAECERLRTQIANGDTGHPVPIIDGDVLLTNLDIFNGNSDNWAVNSGGKEDTLGADYSTSDSYIVVGKRNWGNGNAEYYIDGQYTKLTGNIAPHSSASSERFSTIQIWGDDKLLYESPEIGIRTDVFSFEIGPDKLSNVRFLKIVQEGSSSIPLLLTSWTLS